MAQAKKPTSKKKVKLRAVPKANKELTAQEARALKGGMASRGPNGGIQSNHNETFTRDWARAATWN